jgi:phosphohistidine phosphatase
MLRLLLLRHAKAAPSASGGDHERPLTERGRADAARLGVFLADKGRAPQAAVHSGAARTAETLAIVLGKLGRDVPVSAEPRLYGASEAEFLDVLRALPDEAARILVVGHNPTLGDVALRLAGDAEERDLAKMRAGFPTAGLAILDFEASRWRDIDEGSGRLVRFVTPASLSEGD